LLPKNRVKNDVFEFSGKVKEIREFQDFWLITFFDEINTKFWKRHEIFVANKKQELNIEPFCCFDWVNSYSEKFSVKIYTEEVSNCEIKLYFPVGLIFFVIKMAIIIPQCQRMSSEKVILNWSVKNQNDANYFNSYLADNSGIKIKEIKLLGVTETSSKILMDRIIQTIKYAFFNSFLNNFVSII